MKSRTFFSAIALVAGLLVLVGVVGFWGLTAQNPRTLLTRGGQAQPAAAQFVPRQAPVMISLLARPDRLWQLRQLFTAPGRRFAARQEWQVLKQTLSEWIGWDYDTDVRPWLDQEVTFAVTTDDLDRDRQNGQQPGYLAVLSCREGQQAREALHVLWQQRAVSGQNLVFETVSGISLIYDQLPTESGLNSIDIFQPQRLKTPTLASAVIGDRYVLLANHPQVLRQAITAFQAPDVSLAQDIPYQTALQTLPKTRIGWLYANVPTLLTWLGLEETPPTPQQWSQGQRAQRLFVALQAAPDALLGQLAIAAAPGTQFPAQPAATEPLQVLDWIPADPLFALAGQNLAAFVRETATTIGGYGVAQRSLDTLQQALTLSVSESTASPWQAFSGEYGLALLGGDTPSWILIAQAAQAPPLTPLDEFAQQQGLNVSHVSLDGRDITTWTRLTLTRTAPQQPPQLNTQVVGVHTRQQGYEILSTSLAGLDQVLQVDAEAALSHHPTLVDLTQHLEDSPARLAYLNWPQLAPSLYRRFPWLRLIEQAGQPLTQHLGPMVISGDGSNPLIQQGGIAVALGENS